MTKNEFRSYVKEKFSGMGFESYKSINYKYIEEDYIVCLELYPSSYCKGYQCTCGAIFLPNEDKFPLCGRYDVSSNFQFPREAGCELDFSLPVLECHVKYDYKCEYEKYTREQIERYFDNNIAHFLVPLYDREYALDFFRRDWRRFKHNKPEHIVNICKKADMDPQQVFSLIGKQHIDSVCKRSGKNTQETLDKLGIIL